MKIALAGNPNSGKTTLFNALTRQNQKIGNWPGVTTEKKEGRYFRDKDIEIIDLPGVYSLRPISGDEKVTCAYLRETPPDAVINVVDSANLEGSLALTLQLIETGIPVVLALNMEDELRSHGLSLNVSALENDLSVSALLISARKNKNLDALIEKARAAAKNGSTAKFVSIGADEEEKIRYRHGYIASRIDLWRIKSVSKIKKITERIDRIVLNKWLAFPIFAAVIWLMYFVSVQSVGALSISLIESLFDGLRGAMRSGMENAGVAGWLISLTADGIMAGIGAVFAFIPQILILFLFIIFLESCGYMSRVAAIMDRIFRKLGLSGKSFIPMIVGCGCSVPAILTAKTVDGENEKCSTIMLTPFIPCSAKLPVFALMAGALFPNNSFVAPSMYFLGIFMVIIGGLILKAFNRKKISADTFIIELPHYRLPQVKNILKELWDKIKDFLIRAGTIIIPAAIVLWFLRSFGLSFSYGVPIEESLLAYLGRGIAWIFAPLGFGNWQSSVAILSGIFAKETVVATFGVIFGGEATAVNAALAALFTPQAAYAFMAFILLSAPCVAALAATKKEMGGAKGMWKAIGFQCAAGYIAALFINQLGNLWSANRAVFATILVLAAVALAATLSVKHILKGGGKKAAGCSGCGGCENETECKGDKK